MHFPQVPNWLSIILLILSFLSFLPQISHTLSRKSSTGISTCYLLFNLISATEQFSLAFLLTVNVSRDHDFFAHEPVNAGDWVNLAQTAVVALMWLMLFIVCLYLPSGHRDTSRTVAVSTYIAFLLISVVPVFADAVNPGRPEDREWFVALYSGVHTLFLSWIITGLNIASLYVQIKELRLRPLERALSHTGLGLQASIFTLVAISWVLRVNFPYDKFAEVPLGQVLSAFGTWYELVGWATVDNAIFAIVQAVLLWVCIRQEKATDEVENDETTPLLHDE